MRICNDGRVHFSELKRIDDSPKHFRDAPPPEDTRPFRLGRYAHRAWLLNDLDTIPHWKGRRDKRNDDYASALARNDDEPLLNEEEYEQVCGMTAALYSHDLAMSLRRQCSHFEKYVQWERLGISCAGTIDGCGPSIILDLKSNDSRSMSPRAFQRKGRRLHYPEQLAWYAIGNGCEWRPRDIEWPKAYNIVVEQTRPHDVVVHELQPLLLDQADANVIRWLQAYSACHAAGRWPGHADDAVIWDGDVYTGELDG